MRYDYSKLCGRIREICGNERDFAVLLGKSKATISSKLNGKVEFTQNEIEKTCEVLRIDTSEIQTYFLTQKSNLLDERKARNEQCSEKT